MKINNPLTGKLDHICVVLHMLSSQESCDGDPYDQLVIAADYIEQLEKQISDLQEKKEKLFAVVLDIGWRDSQHIPSIWTERKQAEVSHYMLSVDPSCMVPPVVVEFDSDTEDGLSDAIRKLTEY
jgi:hypothetical protein